MADKMSGTETTHRNTHTPTT